MGLSLPGHRRTGRLAGMEASVLRLQTFDLSVIILHSTFPANNMIFFSSNSDLDITTKLIVARIEVLAAVRVKI